MQRAWRRTELAGESSHAPSEDTRPGEEDRNDELRKAAERGDPLAGARVRVMFIDHLHAAIPLHTLEPAAWDALHAPKYVIFIEEGQERTDKHVSDRIRDYYALKLDLADRFPSGGLLTSSLCGSPG